MGTVWALQVTSGRELLATFLMKWGGHELVFDLPVAVFRRARERASSQLISAPLAHGGSPSEANRAARKNGSLGTCGILALKIAIKCARNQ